LLLDSAFDGGFAPIKKKNYVRKSAINALLNELVGLCLNLVLLGKENRAFMYFAVLELCCSFFRFF
jgi:hypothetical protein